MAASRSSQRASNGIVRVDSSVEGAPGSESGDIGLSSVERALGSARNPPGHSGQVGRAARQGVPGIGSAASRKVEHTEREGTPRHVSGLGPGGGRQSPVPAGASGAKRGATRGRRALVVIRRLREWRLVPTSAKQPTKRGGPGSGGQHGASPALESVDSPRVLVKTDWLQRLVRSTFSPLGDRRTRGNSL